MLYDFFGDVKKGWGGCQTKIGMSGFYQNRNVRFLISVGWIVL